VAISSREFRLSAIDTDMVNNFVGLLKQPIGDIIAIFIVGLYETDSFNRRDQNLKASDYS
jgi:hypothetical protein